MSNLPNTSWVQNITDNPIEHLFTSFTTFFGASVFWMLIIGIIGVAIYLHSNRNLPITIGYFLITQLFLAAAIPSIMTIVFLIITSLMAASLAYFTYFRKQ